MVVGSNRRFEAAQRRLRGDQFVQRLRIVFIHAVHRSKAKPEHTRSSWTPKRNNEQHNLSCQSQIATIMNAAPCSKAAMAMLERMTLVGKRPDWCACVTQCAQIDANSREGRSRSVVLNEDL